ncbi:hypothetical protein CK203_054448 [Vitis vinifera]|uniref:Uncharacterized protein n=1 Tax=Vitis vinifera TaxID=29760 RepID=A0A438H094_VITVI|nr:hypothetical protein CK203_054448 [Vitis vinifera]
MYFDGATNHFGYGIGVLLISPHGDHIPRSVRWHSQIDILPRTTLLNIVVRHLLIESRFVPVYCCLIDDAELGDGLPWYHNIYYILRLGTYPEVTTAKDKRALR